MKRDTTKKSTLHSLLKHSLFWLVLLTTSWNVTGCSTANTILGGNSRKEAIADVSWAFAKDAVTIDISAETTLNQYADQAHTLLLAIYQMSDTTPFYQLIANPAMLAQSMGGDNKANAPFVQFSRYVVEPGQRSILILDRAQQTRFIGIAAGYYNMTSETSTRLFEIPLDIVSHGIIGTTYQATAAPLALRLHLGADTILNTARLDHDPSEQYMQKAVPLDGGGKEIKLTPEHIKDVVNDMHPLQKLEN